MKLSTKIEAIEKSDLAKVRMMSKDYESRGIKVIHLERGEPDFDAPPYVAEGVYKALKDGYSHYPVLQGEPALREALAEKCRAKNNIECGPEHIGITVGGMHGLYVALRTVLNPGEEVLILTPYWLSISKLVGLADGVCKYMPFYTGILDENYTPQQFEADLLENVGPKTRMVYINSPNNPSGAVVPHEHLEVLCKVAKEKDLVILSDEPYEDIIFDGMKHESIAAFPGMFERTITCFAFSKSYAMTGLRLGYLVGPADFTQLAWSRLILYTTNGIPTAIQIGAIDALKKGDADIERMRSAYEERRNRFVEALRRVKGIRTPMPKGAFYVFADVSELRAGRPIYDLIADWLEVGVGVAPGKAFGAEHEDWVRFSTASSMEDLLGAAGALEKRYGTK